MCYHKTMPKTKTRPTISLPKQRIKSVFDKSVKNIRKGKRANVSGNMLDHGYSASASKALQVTRTKTWQDLLKDIDDRKILDKIYSIAMDEDKRASLQASDMLLKLKDKYPASKHKFMPSLEARENLME